MHLQWELHYRIAGKDVPIFGLVLLDKDLPLNKAIILVRTVNCVMSSRNSTTASKAAFNYSSFMKSCIIIEEIITGELKTFFFYLQQLTFKSSQATQSVNFSQM